MSEADESKKALFRAVEEQLKAWRDEREAQGAQVEAYFQGFSDNLQSEDLTGVLIRGHLYVENEMNRVLANAMPNFETVLKQNLEFNERLTLLRAVCLISAEEWIAFKALNTARNSLAHMRNPGVIPVATSDLVRNLYQVVTRQLRDDVEMDSTKAENDGDALREIIMSLMVHLYVRAEVTSDKKGMDDYVHYHRTGETVQQRREAAFRAMEHDGITIKAVKEAILALPYEDRANIVHWAGEVFHY